MIVTERRSENRFTTEEAFKVLSSVYPALTKTRLAKRVLALKRAELLSPVKGENNADLFSEHDVNVLSELLHIEEQGVPLKRAISILKEKSEPLEYATLSRKDLIAIIQRLSEEQSSVVKIAAAISQTVHLIMRAPLWQRLAWALFPQKLIHTLITMKGGETCQSC